MTTYLIDKEHQIFKRDFSNSIIISKIKNDSPNFRSILATSTFSFKNKSQKTYVKWILNKTHLQFYIMPFQNNGIILVKHDFNRLVGLRFCDTITSKV